MNLSHSPRTLIRVTAAIVLCGLAVAFCPASSSAQTVINSVPYYINTSGKYVLGGNLNLTTSGSGGIYITASNVILDLNGFYISGVPNTPSSGYPVIEVENVSNVTIRNGTLANDGYGIALKGGSNALNYLVENVNFTRCYFSGVFFFTASPGSVVRRCSFSQIGGTAYTGSSPIAIRTAGGVRVENNAITNVTASSAGNTGVGIKGDGADLAIGNTIYNVSSGIIMSAQGKYLDNLTSICTTPFTGGVNATGNN